jgi:hypothetical protein
MVHNRLSGDSAFETSGLTQPQEGPKSAVEPIAVAPCGNGSDRKAFEPGTRLRRQRPAGKDARKNFRQVRTAGPYGAIVVPPSTMIV